MEKLESVYRCEINSLEGVLTILKDLEREGFYISRPIERDKEMIIKYKGTRYGSFELGEDAIFIHVFEWEIKNKLLKKFVQEYTLSIKSFGIHPIFRHKPPTVIYYRQIVIFLYALNFLP